MGKFRGDQQENAKLYDKIYGHCNNGIKNPKTKYDWMCSVAEVNEAYDQDPLCGQVLTRNAYSAYYRLLYGAYEHYNWHVNNKRMPFLLLAGQEDPMIGNMNKMLLLREHLIERGYLNVEIRVYKGMSHDILQEREKEKVYHDIATPIEVWLERV